MAIITPDLSSISTSFVEMGANIFRNHVNDLDLSNDGVLIYKNVKTPQALPKLTVTGGPRPYRADDDFTTPAAFADRVLTVNQSKWDFQIDPEVTRNTYLAKWKPGMPSFADYIISSVATSYLASINDNVVYTGVYNAAGTTPAALATGWGTIIAAEITATHLTPFVTGAITVSNAVAKVTSMVSSLPLWMRKMGFRLLCSYAVFDLYAQNFAATFGFKFLPDLLNRYPINNSIGYLWPVTWMGTSQRLIATIDDNLVMGTDGDNIQVAATPHLNLIQVREMMPLGFQIADLQAIVVNDQA